MTYRCMGSDGEPIQNLRMSQIASCQLRVQHLSDGVDLDDFVLLP